MPSLTKFAIVRRFSLLPSLRPPLRGLHGVAVLASGAAIAFAIAGTATAQSTTRESVSSAGAQGNSYSWYPVLSATGRYVAFESGATNLVANDTNFRPDIFVRDRSTEQTTRVSVSSSGAQGTGNAQLPSISGNGQLVAFMSDSLELLPGGTPQRFHIYVHDRLTAETARVSINAAGVPGNAASRQPSISADGSTVIFESSATDLVDGDTNSFVDVFVHDRVAGVTSRISVATDGTQGNGHSGGDVVSRPRISADGRFAAFQSLATNLVQDGGGSGSGIYVHDRQTASTTRVSVSSAGAPAVGSSFQPSISADGRFVAFASTAVGLVVPDTNGSIADIFVHDRQTGQTGVVSVSSSGVQGNNFSNYPSISGDGRFVAFWTLSTNLVPFGPSGSVAHLFVHDRQTGETILASVATDGTVGNGDSREPEFSADGRYVAFHSTATTLVAADTNGVMDVFVRDLGAAAGPAGDLNGDGIVNGADLGILLSSWGPCAGCAADLDGDGDVDGADLGILLAAWSV